MLQLVTTRKRIWTPNPCALGLVATLAIDTEDQH
jgi:hypothetical protein